jgi:uncharacterized membrane protein YeaQ/YmgE (transglycosylase-associated protein family)
MSLLARRTPGRSVGLGRIELTGGLPKQVLEIHMTLTHLLILLLVGAVVGLIAERLVNRALPYGWIGAIAAGLLGAWLMTDVLDIIIAPQVSVVGIPLISAILGAMIVVFVFSLISGGGRFGYRGPRTHRKMSSWLASRGF